MWCMEVGKTVKEKFINRPVTDSRRLTNYNLLPSESRHKKKDQEISETLFVKKLY